MGFRERLLSRVPMGMILMSIGEAAVAWREYQEWLATDPVFREFWDTLPEQAVPNA